MTRGRGAAKWRETGTARRRQVSTGRARAWSREHLYVAPLKILDNSLSLSLSRKKSAEWVFKLVAHWCITIFNGVALKALMHKTAQAMRLLQSPESRAHAQLLPRHWARPALCYGAPQPWRLFRRGWKDGLPAALPDLDRHQRCSRRR